MAKKKKPLPGKGDRVRNKVSGRIEVVKRVSPFFGWFQLEGHGSGWTPWKFYTKVRKGPDGEL